MRRLLRLLALIVSLTIAAALAAPASASAAWVWPVSGEVITPYRNGTDPYANGQHRGIDIGAPIGTAVVAAAGGEVRFAGTAGSSGLTISIRTGDGYDTSYLHLSSVTTRAGSHVSTGDRIGAVGTTGTRSTAAPHLHFGVRDAGTRHDYRDPLTFLPPPAAPAPAPEPPPAPATAPQPAPPAAAPVTVPRTAPSPLTVPRTAPTPRPLPRPHLRPVPHTRPHPVPRTGPHPARHTRPHPVSHTGPHPVRHTVQPTIRDPRPDAVPRVGVSRHPDGIPRPAHATPVPRPGAQGAPLLGSSGGSAAGPDIGWIAACIGLLLAAGALGLKGDRTARTSGRIGRLVRPLAARR